MDILRRAGGRETDSRNHRARIVGWAHYSVGATAADIKRLLEGGMVEIVIRDGRITTYRLTETGQGLIAVDVMEMAQSRVPAGSVLEAMQLVVGYDDLKEAIAHAVAARSRTHFMLEGPPACAKSVMLEAVRAAVADAYIAFGSQTSAAGLSDALFERQPSVLLLDEADKMRNDVYAILLGLMEKGEVLETKSRKTRGIQLNTTVLAACNNSSRMPREFLSRFALHAVFPEYTRDEFITVCRGFLRVEGCSEELAGTIGQWVYDNSLGDVRKARGVWQLMTAPTITEVQRVVTLMLRYGGNGQTPARGVVVPTARMAGM